MGMSCMDLLTRGFCLYLKHLPWSSLQRQAHSAFSVFSPVSRSMTFQGTRLVSQVSRHYSSALTYAISGPRKKSYVQQA